MARVTRSNDKAKEKAVEPLPPAPPKSVGAKKRKRTSLTDHEGQPTTKQARNDTGIKQEDGIEQSFVDDKGAGDVPLDPEDAKYILEILEKLDTQGLLDRVFPLPADPTESNTLDPQSSTTPQSYSFRTLLKESSRHPARVLKAAVQPLFPVFAHPRSRPSAPAAQQLRFCNLALSLLQQSCVHNNPSLLHLETIIPDRTDSFGDDDDSTKQDLSPSPLSSNVPRKRKYALMQKLPTGEWWTSLNSEATSSDAKELKGLQTGHAELVAILPTPSSSDQNPPSLGSYSKQTPSRSTAPSGSRRVSTGAFLDYGPYASFAPTFDQEGVEVGQVALGEVLWSEQRKRELLRTPGSDIIHREPFAAISDDVEMQDVNVEAVDPIMEEALTQVDRTEEEALQSLFSPEQVASIKGALDTIELESLVQELLDRTSSALRRLEELQLRRLGGPNGGSTPVEVNSEEWAVAQGITDSLALIASLRPQTSADPAPLVPPPSVLHKLHRTLPVGVSQGWQGTLPSDHTTALRDDTTLHIKSGTVIPAPVLASTSTSALPVAPATPVAASNPMKVTGAPSGYPGYSYAGYASGQYRTGYNYPQNASNYYPNAYAQTPTAGQSTSTYTPQYNSTGHQQYSYGGSWYNYQPTGTTTPGQALATATSQSPFVNGAQQSGTPRVVANTVGSSKQYTPSTWGQGAGYAPTLPAHMRGMGTPGAQQPPATPTPSGGTTYPYFQGYQQPAAGGQR
ncbi:hypothetical protein OF83DRAFT_1170845 [Amylostereum chailletii]|nr:hypothetical protein OF83DRAFT_1170845 [Amylostereum chailletii]